MLRRAYKHVLAAVQVWAKLDQMLKDERFRVGGLVPGPSESEYFLEFFADIVGSFSSMVHGMYKPANILLRSAVENLVRGLAGVLSSEALQTKSVYRLFEIAQNEPAFTGVSATKIAELHVAYGELCLFAHSATSHHRSGSTHVAAYMRHDTARMREYLRFLERVNSLGLGLLVGCDRNLYLGCTGRVRDTLDDVLPTEVRLWVLGLRT